LPNISEEKTMVINPKVILVLLKQLGKILIVVGPLLVNLKEVLKKTSGSKDIQQAMELQTTIIENLDSQLKIVETVLETIQKSIVTLTYVSYGAAFLAFLALVLWAIK
jgi:CO dehydrogenase/acetyl-CoA synthase epsilon subunit